MPGEANNTNTTVPTNLKPGGSFQVTKSELVTQTPWIKNGIIESRKAEKPQTSA